MTKRLFLFASYDKNNVIDDTVVHYIKHLSTLGDVIFVMDNYTPPSELKKITDIDNVLYVSAVRHCEYDFGSYKRGYVWAKSNNILENYDWMYLVNDSVYGPLSALHGILSDLENRGVDEVGMVENSEEYHPTHIQSWFLGVSKKIFLEQFFYDFMKCIKHEDKKIDIITKYEVRLSRLILRNGFKLSAYTKNEECGVNICTQPVKALIQGVPFIKKSYTGVLSAAYLLNAHTDFPDLIDKIKHHMDIYDMHFGSNKYKKIYRLAFLSIPIFSIYKKRIDKTYKVYLFDKILILKISK